MSETRREQASGDPQDPRRPVLPAPQPGLGADRGDRHRPLGRDEGPREEQTRPRHELDAEAGQKRRRLPEAARNRVRRVVPRSGVTGRRDGADADVARRATRSFARDDGPGSLSDWIHALIAPGAVIGAEPVIGAHRKPRAYVELFDATSGDVELWHEPDTVKGPAIRTYTYVYTGDATYTHTVVDISADAIADTVALAYADGGT